MNTEQQFSTLVDLLSYRAIHQSEQTAFTFLQNGEIESGKLTYQELDRRARAIATKLQSIVTAGQRALLLYHPGLEFIAAFFGCLYAEVIAVPAYLPRRNRKISRSLSIIADAQATLTLTTTSVLSNIKVQFAENPELAKLYWLPTDNIKSDIGSDWHKPVSSRDTLAFLQYTSGSTGTPKGVMISHGNLLHNEKMIEQAFGHTSETVVIGWLPFYHDMGLIGNILQPLYLGRPCILMPPVAFLQKPIRWLQTISRYKATTSGGPNFAYDLCVSKIKPKQLLDIDLSSWEIAFTGAEPVQSETLERFASTFAACGFRAQAFYPCYGMAETTLLVSGGLKTSAPVSKWVKARLLEENQVANATPESQGSRLLVGCGHSWLDQQIIIVNPQLNKSNLEREIGEIWVSGGSVAAGYWNRPQQTQKTFEAYLTDGSGPFLRTGDLGFLFDGELFITGRIKDLIIIRGRNFYPRDIEQTVEQSHQALQPNCGAAFAVDIDNKEQLVIVQEVKRTYLRNLDVDDVFRSICQAISEQHRLQVYGITLLKTATIPKTTSGKIQRHACRTAYLNQSLDVVGQRTISTKQINLLQLQSEVDYLFEDQNFTSKEPIKSKQEFDKNWQINRATSDHVELQSKLSQEKIAKWLISHLALSLKIYPNEIDINQSIASYGLDSSAAVSITAELSEWLDLGFELEPTLFWEYPTIKKLAEYLEEQSNRPVAQ